MVIIVAAASVPGVPGVPVAPTQVGRAPAPTAAATASMLPTILLSLPDNAATIIQATPSAMQRVLNSNKNDLWPALGNNAAFISALPGALVANGNTTAVLARDATFIGKMCQDAEFVAQANQDPMIQQRMTQAQSESMASIQSNETQY